PAAETATAKCTNPLLRKEIRQLDDKEFATLISAFRKMKEATGPNSLDYLSHMHMDNAMAVHGNPTFLVWHRRYLRAFEEGLRAHEPTVTVPYWDWGVDAQAPEQSILFTEGYLGGNGRAGDHCVTNGPFAGWTMNVPNQHCLPRQFNNGDHITPFWPSEALIRMQQTSNTYDELRRSIENGCHGAVHLGISGDMSTMQAPNDLYFFLHHCMIDKIYTEWQSVNPGVRNFMYDGTDPTGRKVMIDDPLPAFNEHVKDVLDVRSPVNCYEY
ncbi:Di-copper centre-containing protein, partial [Ramicandelaber brevisporus]